jgi:glycosyltransferase involved in cell wall biosynthesis
MRHASEIAPAPFNANNPGDTAPDISIVIPVYNEEAILENSIDELVLDMTRFALSYEIVLTENGSKDRTVEIAHALAERYPQLRLLRNPQPDYGLALRNGIKSSRATYVLCDEIDICDVGFYADALQKLVSEEAEMVVGSKALKNSNDQRPAFRRFATFSLNLLLRIFLGFRGTDTHGLKAFRRDKLLATVDRCVVNRDLFASEFVIRAQRDNAKIIEIPITIEEKRPPSINLFRRVPHVLKNLARLFWVIRVKGDKGR